MIKLRHDFYITLVVTLCLVAADARYYPLQSILSGGNPDVLDILLRDKGNPEISTVLSDRSKPILRIDNPVVAATHRDHLKLVADDIPETSATLHANPKPNLHGGSLKLLARLREYTKPHLNNPAGLRVRKDSESDNNLFPTDGINKYTVKDNDLKQTFTRIVETVPKVNDERILSLKKLFELDNYLPQVSRTTQQKNPLIAIIMNTSNYRSKYDNLNINHLTKDPQYVIVKIKHKEPSMLNIFKEILEGTYFNLIEDNDEVNISKDSDDDDKNFTKNYYLRGWKCCNKNASKACQKACKKAFKSICSDYQCSSSLKKDGKKQCKKRCEDEFINT